MISCEVNKSVAIVHLDDTGRLNVLTRDLIKNLNLELDRLESHDDVHVIILTGRDRIFSAGADLREFVRYRASHENDDFIEPWQRLSRFSKPVLIALNGVAAGGGLELALMGDVIFAAETAKIGQPELSVGVIPGGGATQRLTKRIGRSITSYMCLTGKMFSAQQAHAWGIVHEVIPDRDLMNHVLEIAHHIAQRPLPLLKRVKACIQKAEHSSMEEGILFERKLFFETFQLEDHPEAISAFFEKRAPSYTHRDLLSSI